MKRILWPGIVFVLIGALVTLDVVTMVVAGVTPVVTSSRRDARPRAGWTVELSAAGGVLAVHLADAGGSPIDDAAVRVHGEAIDAELDHVGAGRYEATLARPAAWRPCRVEVDREGHTWTFDRVVGVAEGAS